MAELVLAEFETPEALARAIEHAKASGAAEVDAHTPYSTDIVREALGRPRSKLSFAVFAGFATGAGGAYGLEWLLVAYDYPLNVGGRPPHMPFAYVPIAFEMGVLFAAFAAFLGALWLGRLVRLWDPVFEVEGFESASADRFWLSVRHDAPSERTAELTAELEGLGATRVERRTA